MTWRNIFFFPLFGVILLVLGRIYFHVPLSGDGFDWAFRIINSSSMIVEAPHFRWIEIVLQLPVILTSLCLVEVFRQTSIFGYLSCHIVWAPFF